MHLVKQPVNKGDGNKKEKMKSFFGCKLGIRFKVVVLQTGNNDNAQNQEKGGKKGVTDFILNAF